MLEGFVPHGRKARIEAYDAEVVFGLGFFGETVRAGCAEAFLNHDMREVIGRQYRDSLVLEAQPDGLHVLLRVANGPAATAIRSAAWAGRLNGVSPDWRRSEVTACRVDSGLIILTAGSLRGISLLTGIYRPAFPGAWARIVSG
jgi:HK97 family phage prohead protease